MSQTHPASGLRIPGVRRLLSSRIAAALAYPHSVDRYLEVFDPTWSVNEVRATVTAVRHRTADSVSLSLEPNGNWRGFRAGQFVRLSVEIDGALRTRCYSPANSVHGPGRTIELTAKAHASGLVSRYLHRNARVGRVVTLSQAEGSFALPEARPRDILLISGGSGITPVMSMLRTLCDEGHPGRISFLHYARAASDLIYAEELAAIAARHPNVRVLRSFSVPDQGGELQGRFNRGQLEQALPGYAQAETFLCGPPGMMRAVEAVWAEDGIGERLHLERFTAAPRAIDGGVAEGEVRFARSERVSTNTGLSLLEQAEAAGLRPQSGCRMGICHTCTCRKTSGTVRNLQTGALSSEADEDIRICISAPVGTVTLDL